MSEKKSFLKNIFSNYFIFALRIGIGIYALPVCLNAFGTEVYGLYIICFGLSSAMAAFDFGSSKSIFRYTVEYNTNKDKLIYRQAFNIGFSFNFYASIIIGLGMLMVGFFSTSIFNMSPESEETSLQLFLFAALNAFLITLDAVPQNVLTANKYFHNRNKFQLIIIALNLALLINLQLGADMSILTFAICTTILTAISLVFDTYLVYAYKLLSGIGIKLIADKSLFKNPYSNYSVKAFLLSLVSFLAVQADRIVIGSVLDVASVTIYAIITKPYFVMRGVIGVSYPVIQPTLNKLNLETNKSAFIVLTNKVIRIGLLLMICVTMLASIFYSEIITLWLGTNEYNEHVKWGILSLITLCVAMLYNPYYRTMVHTNQITTILKFSIIAAAGNITIGIILSGIIGFQGVIIATFLQIIAELIFSYTWFKPKLKSEAQGTFSFSFIRTLIILIALGAACGLLEMQYQSSLLIESLLFATLFSIMFLMTFKYIKTERLFSYLDNSAKPNPKMEIS